MVVYMSISHSNTEKVAKVIADTLSADLKKADQIDPSSLSDYDLIGFGSGIHNGKHHKSLLSLVESLPQSNKKAFIFSTAGYVTEKNVQKYHEPIRKALLSKGYDIIGEFNWQGLDTAGLGRLRALNKGRPNEEDLKEAEDFQKPKKSKLMFNPRLC
jgi:flavodoxin